MRPPENLPYMHPLEDERCEVVVEPFGIRLETELVGLENCGTRCEMDVPKTHMATVINADGNPREVRLKSDAFIDGSSTFLPTGVQSDVEEDKVTVKGHFDPADGKYEPEKVEDTHPTQRK